MNNTKDLKYLRSLLDELERTGNSRPYDPDAYNDVVDRLNRLFTSQGQCRRRRPWAAVIVFIFLFLVLLYIVFEILFNLKITERL